jgi:AcrR family transcriptional regulator
VDDSTEPWDGTDDASREAQPEPARSAAPRTARAVARSELTRAILSSARRQLGEVGPAQLSVRAVARELGMASSAVYRYFPSRDELLTALLVAGYTELGDAAEHAESSQPPDDFVARWAAFAAAVRRWALDHPHDFALLFGSPVPGYAAPRTTVEPATRITGQLIRLARDIQAAGAAPPPLGPVSTVEHDSLARIREFAGADLDDDLALRALRAWSGLIGHLTLELFGHFANGITDLDSYFTAMSRQLAPVPAPAR